MASGDTADAARQAVSHDDVLYVSITALLEALAAIDSQLARLDDEVKELARRSPVCWRLMGVPGVGAVTALAFVATVEDVGRFRRVRDIGAYLGLTPGRYQWGEADVVLGITRQGDAMARHYLYEAARAQAGPGCSGAQARNPAWPAVEGRSAFRGRAGLTDRWEMRSNEQDHCRSSRSALSTTGGAGPDG